MNVILGFGQTETDFQKDVLERVEDIFRDVLKTHNHEWLTFLTDEERTDVDAKLGELEIEARKEYDKADNSKNRPERYSNFSISTADNGRFWFCRVDFWHINSKHPLSPDGMALLQESRTISLDLYNSSFRREK